MVSHYSLRYLRTQDVTQASPEFDAILLSLLSQYWDYRCVPTPRLVSTSLDTVLKVLEIHTKQNEVIPSHDFIIY